MMTPKHWMNCLVLIAAFLIAVVPLFAIGSKGVLTSGGGMALGALVAIKGIYDDAIDAFRAALFRNPNDTRSKRGLVTAYRANGMNSQADALEKTLPPDEKDSVRQPTQM